MKKCLLALALLFAVLLSGCAIVQTTDLADYGNTGGETWHGSAVFDLLSNLTSTGDADGTQSAAPPRMQELFPIFPPDALLQRAQDRDYHHLYRYTLLQDELFTRLSCRYSAADYQAEVDRLAALGATYDTTLFRLPAYIWMLHDTDNSEYVLLEESTRTIHYIACQTTGVITSAAFSTYHQVCPAHRNLGNLCKLFQGLSNPIHRLVNTPARSPFILNKHP